MTNEMSGPSRRALTTERTGDPDRSRVASGATQGAGAGMLVTLAEVVDEEGGTNGYAPLSQPASRGTGPVDPAYDFVDNDRG
jgi:hypothetical protein